MDWIYMILSLIVFIILFVLFVGINISFVAEYKDKTSDLGLRVYVICRAIGKDITFSKKEPSDDTSDLSDEEDTASQTESGKKTVKEFLSHIKNTVKRYLNYKDAFMMTAKRLRKHFVFKNLQISLEYGDSDACTTAVATGSMWGLIYNILGFVTKISTVKKHSENVTPRYNQRCFYIRAEGILKLRLAHIIWALILFKINHRKILKAKN